PDRRGPGAKGRRRAEPAGSVGPVLLVSVRQRWRPEGERPPPRPRSRRWRHATPRSCGRRRHGHESRRGMAEARYHRFVALATEAVPTIIHPKTIKDSVRYRNGTVSTTQGQDRNGEPWRAPGSHRTVCTSVVLFPLVDSPRHQR